LATVCPPNREERSTRVIDVVFIWFSDRMLFTLTTQKRHLVQQIIKCWSKNAFGARMTFSQLLLVTDSAYKLDCIGVIFVDPAVQVDET